MPEELPSGDKAVYVFIEMIALGFVLYAVEEAFKEQRSWTKVAIAVVLGIAFFALGVKWPQLRQKVARRFAGGQAWSIVSIATLMLLIAYDIYDRNANGMLPIHWWQYVPIFLIVLAVIGLVIRGLARKTRPSKLVIHSANYRAVESGGETYQVGDFLRKMISGDSLFIEIENHNFGSSVLDPLPLKEKRLQVTYSYAGSPPITTERREHGRLLLPEDTKIKWLQSEVDRLKAAQPKPSSVGSPNPVRASLVPWKGKGEKMFLTVTNLGPQRQAFQGQCRILARRNDPNTPQLITFDLQWEYGGQSYTLAPGQAGNLLIASAGHGEHKEMEWLQLESAPGAAKPQRSDWNFGDKLPEYDIEVTILGDGEPQREKFTVRAGKECAIEMSELREIDVKPDVQLKEIQQQIPSILVNGIPVAGPAKFAADRALEEVASRPLSSLFSLLQVKIFDLAQRFKREAQEFLEANPSPDIPTKLRHERFEGTVSNFLEWKHRFAGWYRSQFSSQLQQVRDELAARGFRDDELDSALSDMSAMSQSAEKVDLIVTKLRFLASSLEGKYETGRVK